MAKLKTISNILCLWLLLSSSTMADVIKRNDAARFLMQSTIGFDVRMVEKLMQSGKPDWIQRQLKQKPTKLEPYLIELRRRQESSPSSTNFAHQRLENKSVHVVGKVNFRTAWLRALLDGNDALRQKVAWALSQIFVVSIENTAHTLPAANYYDMLLDGAYWNFSDLLIAVTYHPMMGHYLSYLGNEKADPSTNRFPDENFAREVMQLFTIGLWKLNDDGSYTVDSNNERIPTYTIGDIENGARVFTGFELQRVKNAPTRWDRYRIPMQLDDSKHDKDSKSFFSGKLKLPANTSAEKEIKQFLQALANHKNTAPFISRRLIQHLVTSNPSAEYISRITAKWRESSGNLGEIVTSILLDPEAQQQRYNSYGKLKDPVSRVVQVITAFQCFKTEEVSADSYPGLQWWRPSLLNEVGQEPMKSPSVFNFYQTDYSKPGIMQNESLTGPEFQILDDVTSVKFSNYIWQGLTRGFHVGRKSISTNNSVVCDFKSKKLPTEDLNEFADYANLMLSAGKIEEPTLEKIVKYAKTFNHPNRRLSFIINSIATSAESAILN